MQMINGSIFNLPPLYKVERGWPIEERSGLPAGQAGVSQWLTKLNIDNFELSNSSIID